MIVTVLIIWSYILLKIIGIRKSNPVKDNTIQRENIEITNLVEDTIKLLLDYPDPFIAQAVSRQKVNQDIKSRQLRKETEKEAITVKPWPNIIYGGMISQVGDTSSVGIFTLDNKKFICCNSDSAGAVKVHLITSDTLFISFNNTIKSIAKNISK